MGKKTLRKSKLKGGAAKETKDTAKMKKPIPLCQCTNAGTGKGCTKAANGNSLFCAEHQNCPKPPLSGYEPKYDPQRWNQDPAVTKSHNCYNYYANYINPNSVEECRKKGLKGCRTLFAQPGGLHGDRNALNAEKRRVCPVLEQLMMKDIPGLTKTSFYEKCPAGTSKGAMVNDEFVDFHFVVQDDDGMWSHKDGSNKAKRFDALGRPIFNPELAARNYNWQGSDLNYDRFCGFYCVPRDHEVVLGQGGFSLTPQERQKLRARKEESRRKARLRRLLQRTRKNR